MYRCAMTARRPVRIEIYLPTRGSLERCLGAEAEVWGVTDMET
jgi:hypothetical protein